MQNIFSIPTSSSCCSSTGGRAGGEDGGGGGQRVGRRRGGFQSDRPTEKSDNERSGLSGVQTVSRKGREGNGKRGVGEGRKRREGCRRKCPLSWVMFDAALLLPTLGKRTETQPVRRP